MIEIRSLEVSYGAVQAVRGIDLSMGTGERIALLGPNGAGKTSTLRAISNLVPHRGTITFDGENIGRLSPEYITRMGLIHVPEGRHVFPTLTVHENLQVGTVARAGRRGGHGIDDVYDLFPPLRRLKGTGGWALSGGEQQMVAIGRALVGAPRLLVLDEPSLGLAPVVTKTVFAALAEVARETPMLLVEQNSTMALQVCSRASVMVGGRFVLSGAAAELDSRQELLRSYLGQRDEAVEDASAQTVTARLRRARRRSLVSEPGPTASPSPSLPDP
jgi:branched-chain amino acid transport system ATP-binding protein